jgi:uncharacterized protein (TIGR02001 family)
MKPVFVSKRFSAVAVAAAVSALFAPAIAQAQVSYNIGVVSLYKASGNDQDDKQGSEATAKNFRPALQGGVDYSFGNGLYIGNWNSTGSFGNGSMEIDLYGGYGGEISKGLSYDLSLATYIYPGSDDGWNGSEAALKLTYEFASIKYVHGLGDYDFDGYNKVVLGLKMSATDSLSLSADYHIRENSGPKSFVLGASYNMGNALTATATVSGTDNDSTSGKTRLVFGLSKGF